MRNDDFGERRETVIGNSELDRELNQAYTIDNEQCPVESFSCNFFAAAVWKTKNGDCTDST